MSADMLVSVRSDIILIETMPKECELQWSQLWSSETSPIARQLNNKLHETGWGGKKCSHPNWIGKYLNKYNRK